MVGTSGISVQLLQHMSGDFRRCLEPAAAMRFGESLFLGTGADQPGGVQTIWTLSCVGLPWINRGYC